MWENKSNPPPSMDNKIEVLGAKTPIGGGGPNLQVGEVAVLAGGQAGSATGEREGGAGGWWRPRHRGGRAWCRWEASGI